MKLNIRTVSFSKDVLAYCRGIKLTAVTTPMVTQLTKSATSIGANYAEAINASSRVDFRNKIFIAKRKQQKLNIG